MCRWPALLWFRRGAGVDTGLWAHVRPVCLDPVETELAGSRSSGRLPTRGDRPKCRPQAILPFAIYEHEKFSGLVLERVVHCCFALPSRRYSHRQVTARHDKFSHDYPPVLCDTVPNGARGTRLLAKCETGLIRKLGSGGQFCRFVGRKLTGSEAKVSRLLLSTAPLVEAAI